METLLQDIRFAIRVLLINPGATTVAVFALAIGSGANTAVFSAVNAVVLKALPYTEPNRLVILWASNRISGVQENPSSVPDFNDYRDQAAVFEDIASFSYADFNLGGAEEPERVQGTLVSANFFSVLGVAPQLGRAFVTGEDSSKADGVVVISDGLWKRRFGTDNAIVGQRMLVNGANFLIVGVAPREFQSPEPEDEIWIPMSFDGADPLRIPSGVQPQDLKKRNIRFLKLVARLRSNVYITEARVEVTAIASRLEQQHSTDNAGVSATVVPLQEQLVGPKTKLTLMALWSAVGFLSLIACANVANLLLARATARQKEIAIRSALGADRLRLMRQMLTESLLLALIAGGIGLLFAYISIGVLLAVTPTSIYRLAETRIDQTVLGYTLVASIIASLIFGLAPALHASKTNLNHALKEGLTASSVGLGHRRISSLLVVSETALTLVLFVGATLMIQSVNALQKVETGFSTEGALTMHRG